MIFSSTLFLFIFLPLTLLIYYAIPKKYVAAKNIELLIASLIFYAWGEPKNVLLMLISIAANYGFGLLLDKYDENKRIRKLVLIGSVIFNLGMLFYFKYLGFFTGGRVTVILPIGISFFTFQIMSYTIDVYLRNVKTQRDPFKLALYISLFPQLIAGPIVRYIDVEKELANRTYDVDKIFKGVTRFSVGLAKKVVISNTVGLLADNIFKLDVTQMSSATGWLGAIAYTLQIYFDFSGYSDMAIGLGHMMGFNFIENFNYPYISKSVQEFWRRWHISLSSWFRDYLYIPLGGNRKGKIRTYINLLIVFACTGFWHGAAWNFLVWGLFHGLFLVIERIGFKKVLAGEFKSLENKPKAAKACRITMTVVGHIYTMLIAIIGWVLFRAETMGKAWQYICTMFRFSDWGWVRAVAQLDGYTLVIILLGIVCSFPIVPVVREKLRKYSWGETAVSIIGAVSMLTLLLLSIFCLTGSDYNPFIYFRF
ncbi:MAG: MBOAT family protein [Clostridia bacterium]|nr:MBOAT family protein [Clostridia bacterium]